MRTLKTKTKLLFLLTVLFLLSVSSAVFLAPQKAQAADDRRFTAEEDFVFIAEKEFAYDGISFEYKITSGEQTTVSFCVLDGEWQKYYGYFSFGVSGKREDYDGVECAFSDDGFIKVTIRFSAVTQTGGEVPKTTCILYSRDANTTASGVIKNIDFFKTWSEETDVGDRERYDGKKFFSGRDGMIYAPMAKLYEKVVFEYKVARKGEEDRFGVCLLDDFNSNYFGYYYFGSEGILSDYINDGVYVTALEDGYYRVVIYVPELKRTNNQNSLKRAPKKINSLFMRDLWMKDDVYIRNVRFLEQSAFSMESGAAIRLEKPYGIKFRARIPQSQFDENDLYGMAIIPYEYLSRYSLTGDYVGQLKRKGVNFHNAFVKAERGDDLDYYVESYIKGLYEEDLDTQYVGIAYRISDGEYVYAENAEGTKRSIREVSRKAVTDAENFRNYLPSGQNVLRKMVGSHVECGSAFDLNAFDSNVNFKKEEAVPDSKKLVLSAAKGESESGEIILTATAAVNGKSYIITPYDLIHEDGETVLSKDNVSFFNGNYTFIDSNYRHVVYPKKNQATDLGTGYSLVNALVPFSAAADAGETVFDISRGANHTIVVDFYVPYAQKAGKYTGEFRIDVPDAGYKTIDVEFTVYDFALPEENCAKTVFAIPTNYLGEVFGVYAGYDSELYLELYDFLLDFNVSGGRLPEVTGYTASDWDKYLSRLISYSSDPKVSAINLFTGFSIATYTYTYDKPKYILGFKVGTETVTETFDDVYVIDEYDRKGSYVNNAGETVVYDDYGLRTVLKKIAEYSIENDVDLFGKLVVNSPQIDEPSSAKNYASAILSYNAVRRSIDHVLSGAGIDWTGHENIRSSLDDIPFLVTVAPEDEVIEGNKIVDNVASRLAYIPADKYNGRVDLEIEYKHLNDFIALVASFDQNDRPTESARLKSYLENRPEHTHVWWYTCCLSVNPYYNYGINGDRVKMRSSRWAQFGMGVDGELYCWVNNWISVADDESITLLTENEIWEGKSNQAGLIEDCMLVYPNVERYAGADFRFVATYRLYAIRESVDDFNYLCYAQKLIDCITDGERKRQAQNLLDGIVGDLYSGVRSVTGDPDAIRHARAEMVDLIMNLRGAL